MGPRAAARETVIRWDGGEEGVYVGTDRLGDIKAMEKLWGKASEVYGDEEGSWHIWYVPRSQAKLPRPKSEALAAASRARMARKRAKQAL